MHRAADSRQAVLGDLIDGALLKEELQPIAEPRVIGPDFEIPVSEPVPVWGRPPGYCGQSVGE
jgi:hypothetical protein